MNIITTSENHGYKPGDVVEIITPDRRWWRRFWYWITFRPPPIRKERYTVNRVTSDTFQLGEKS